MVLQSWPTVAKLVLRGGFSESFTKFTHFPVRPPHERLETARDSWYGNEENRSEGRRAADTQRREWRGGRSVITHIQGNYWLSGAP